MLRRFEKDPDNLGQLTGRLPNLDMTDFNEFRLCKKDIIREYVRTQLIVHDIALLVGVDSVSACVNVGVALT